MRVFEYLLDLRMPLSYSLNFYCNNSILIRAVYGVFRYEFGNL